MRILAVSAHYPPDHLGGYEIRLKNILDELHRRGHTVRVLTTLQTQKSLNVDQVAAYPVLRRLHLRTWAKFFPKEVLYDLRDTRTLEEQIGHFKPELIYLGHTYNLSKALIPFLARVGLPILYDEGGSGLIEAWSEHGRWFRFTGDYRSRFEPLNWLKPLAIAGVCALGAGSIQREWAWPQDMRVIFNSELNRRNALSAGVPLDNARVIHSGVDTRLFSFKPREKLQNPLVILVPGRIERRKGQLDALRLLVGLQEAGIAARLVLVGGRWVDGYSEELTRQIQRDQLEDRVTIHPMVSQEKLVELYHEADICFFPSHFRTGFSRVPLEAMACGCIVISYGNEGSNEIIQNYWTGFLVKQNDVSEIVPIIRELLADANIARKITIQARWEIDGDYSLRKYGDTIENMIEGQILEKAA